MVAVIIGAVVVIVIAILFKRTSGDDKPWPKSDDEGRW